jgi:hypothetical protein
MASHKKKAAKRMLSSNTTQRDDPTNNAAKRRRSTLSPSGKSSDLDLDDIGAGGGATNPGPVKEYMYVLRIDSQLGVKSPEVIVVAWLKSSWTDAQLPTSRYSQLPI